MDKYYKALRDLVERAVANGADRDARLILVGQIAYATVRGDVTLDQGEELEAMLGPREAWARPLEMATFGDVEV